LQRSYRNAVIAGKLLKRIYCKPAIAMHLF
jgi:hypothetical protein